MSEQKKQELIYNAGVKLFGKFGVRKVSIDMIVKKAGVAKGTFYLYYKNKEQLYETIVDDIFDYSAKCMGNAAERYPDLKERLLHDFVGSLLFFEKNDIIRNLANKNPDYLIGKIDIEYMRESHLNLLRVLLRDDFKGEEESIQFLSGLVGLYTHLLHMKSCFPSEEIYAKCAVQLASVMINGFFSDYKSLGEKIDYAQLKEAMKSLKY